MFAGLLHGQEIPILAVAPTSIATPQWSTRPRSASSCSRARTSRWSRSTTRGPRSIGSRRARRSWCRASTTRSRSVTRTCATWRMPSASTPGMFQSGDAARMSLQPRVKRRRKGAQPATW